MSGKPRPVTARETEKKPAPEYRLEPIPLEVALGLSDVIVVLKHPRHGDLRVSVAPAGLAEGVRIRASLRRLQEELRARLEREPERAQEAEEAFVTGFVDLTVSVIVARCDASVTEDAVRQHLQFASMDALNDIIRIITTGDASAPKA